MRRHVDHRRVRTTRPSLAAACCVTTTSSASSNQIGSTRPADTASTPRTSLVDCTGSSSCVTRASLWSRYARFSSCAKIENMGFSRFSIDGVRLTRVPYFDVALGPEVVGLTPADVAAIPWAVPAWATEDNRVLIGQAIWVIELAEQILVVDPCGAADAFLRTGSDAITHQRAVTEALSAAGYGVGQVDTVILSHLDGIGMAAAIDEEGAWRPMFPRARIVLSEAELLRVRAHLETDGAEALLTLVDQGVVEAVGPHWEPATGLVMEVTGGHTPGHALVRVGDGAVFIGHLAVSPLNVTAEMRAGSHDQVSEEQAALETELAEAAKHRWLLIGPLWPEPGAGTVTGPPWAVTPADAAVV